MEGEAGDRLAEIREALGRAVFGTSSPRATVG